MKEGVDTNCNWVHCSSVHGFTPSFMWHRI